MTGHYTTRDRGGKPRPSNKDWLKLTGEIGEQANTWAMRQDLVAYVNSDGGQKLAAAVFFHDTAEIEVNTIEAFGEHVRGNHVGDFRQRRIQLDWPKATGYVAHESSHARWSTVTPGVRAQRLTPDEFRKISDVPVEPAAPEYYRLLEEVRIETQHQDRYPDNHIFLRASATDLMQVDEEELRKSHVNLTTLGLRLLILGYGRQQAGILETHDLDEIRHYVKDHVDETVRQAILRLCATFTRLDDRRDLDEMLRIANEVARLAKQQHTENETNAQDDANGDGEGTGGEELTPEQEKLLQDILKTLQDMSGNVFLTVSEDAADQQHREMQQDRANQKQEQDREQRDNEAQAKMLFSHAPGPEGVATSSRLTEHRPPSDEERVAANKIGRALERAKYRDRLVTERLTEIPPGRLRVGTAMQGVAERQSGGSGVVEPWRKRVRHHVDDPTLRLGIMCDISGSMNRAMQPMGSAVWIMAEAARRVQGRAASVYYGNDVFPVLKAGQTLPEVRVYSAADGTEMFDKAFRSLDGALNLLNGSGARLVIICSDGHYVTQESEACLHWLQRCRQEGVAVVWLGLKGSHAERAQGYCADTGASFIELSGDVLAAADVIGQACMQALTRAGASR